MGLDGSRALDFSNPTTFLIHDGELADVRSLLDELGASFFERTGGLTPEDRRTPWDLAIATPKRMLEFEVPESISRPVRIAVLSGESRTLLKMLQRERIDFVVRRPVHPAALRLLILHALYRGPEKREVTRATIGAPIRFRSGWRWPRAILVDLSQRGCRLVSPHRVRRGERISLKLPGKLMGGKPLALTGRVVRLQTLLPGRRGTDAIAVHFEALSEETALILQATVESYASGPAALPRSIADRYASDDAALESSCGANRPGRARDEDAAGAEAAAAPPEEKRGVGRERRSYSRRVIALGDEVTRILIGRDLSMGGMRVGPHPDLSVGDALRIAIHVRAGEKPLVVSAEVCRDDGDQGLAIQFSSLSIAAQEFLREMLESLPNIEARDEAEEGESVVVSEILHRAACRMS